jgi:hypothetical protein
MLHGEINGIRQREGLGAGNVFADVLHHRGLVVSTETRLLLTNAPCPLPRARRTGLQRPGLPEPRQWLNQLPLLQCPSVGTAICAGFNRPCRGHVDSRLGARGTTSGLRWRATGRPTRPTTLRRWLCQRQSFDCPFWIKQP